MTPLVLADCNQSAPQASFEPTSIILACADGNASLVNIAWSSWTSTAAVGAGTYIQNDCTPDCAGGTFISYPGATLVLSSPWLTFAGWEFSSITFTYPNPGAPGGRSTEATTLEVTTG